MSSVADIGFVELALSGPSIVEKIWKSFQARRIQMDPTSLKELSDHENTRL